MAKFFDAVNRFRKIEEVTSTKDDVPPVYLLDEVADIARESIDAAQSVAEHVVRNLANRNPVVKWKALKLTKHLCQKGCTQFQRCMQRHSSAVRDLVHFKGEPDPFKGDAVNQRVRDLSKEVMELLYAQQAPQAAPGSSLQGRIQGFGSGAGPVPSAAAPTAGGGGYSSSGGGNPRLMAFGSTNTPPPPTGAVATVSNAATMIGSWITGGQSGHNRSGSLGEPVLGGHNTHSHVNHGGFSPLGGAPEPHAAPAPAARAFGGGGGLSGGGGGLALGGGGRGAGVGNEESVVDDMCSGGGLRANPTPEDLRTFVTAVSALDGLRIGELMMKKLGSGQWQAQLRTLCALEAVINKGLSQSCGEVAVMFQSDPAPVRSLTTSPNAQVRHQAAKCLQLLTGEDVAAAEKAAVAAVHVPAMAPPPRAAQPVQPAPDLLGDLADEAPAPTAAAVPAAAAAPAAPAAVVDPFAVLDSIVGPPAAPAAAAPAPAPVPAVAAAATPAAPALDDFFSTLAVAPAAPAAAPASFFPQQQQQQPGLAFPAPVGGFGAPMAGPGFQAPGLSFGAPMTAASPQRPTFGTPAYVHPGGNSLGSSIAPAQQGAWQGAKANAAAQNAAFDFVKSAFK